MPKRIAVVLLAATLPVAVLVGGSLAAAKPDSGKSQAGGKKAKVLFAAMSGRKEVDAQGNKRVGDPDGWGSFTALIDDGQLCYGYAVGNIDAPVAAHIHKGSPSTAGGVVLPLDTPDSGDPGAVSGCTAITAELAAAILKNPRKYYVNVHTGPFPGGAVRGQLGRKST